MIYCPNCGLANRDGSRFCNECGHRVFAYANCAHCGFPNPVGVRFCCNCGQAPQSTPAPAPSPPAAAPTDFMSAIMPSIEASPEEPPLEAELPDLSELLNTPTVVPPLPAEEPDEQSVPSALPDVSSLPQITPLEAADWAAPQPVSGDAPPTAADEPPSAEPEVPFEAPAVSAAEAPAPITESSTTVATESAPVEAEAALPVIAESLSALEDDLPAIDALLEIPLYVLPLESGDVAGEAAPAVPGVVADESPRGSLSAQSDTPEDATVVETSGDPRPENLPSWMVEGRAEQRVTDAVAVSSSSGRTVDRETVELTLPVPGIALARSGRPALDAALPASVAAAPVLPEVGALFSRVAAGLQPPAPSAPTASKTARSPGGVAAARLLLVVVVLVALVGLIAVFAMSSGYVDLGSLNLR